MFDIGASELLVIVIVAIFVIGPKELPQALRTAGRWIGKMRRMSNHFRSGLDAMIREAELEDAEKEWKARNARIMGQDASGNAEPVMEPLPVPPHQVGDEDLDSRAESAIRRAAPRKAPEHGLPRDDGPRDGGNPDEPGLPLDDPPLPPQGSN